MRDKVVAKSTKPTQVDKTSVKKVETKVTTATSFEEHLPVSTNTSSIEKVVQNAKSEMSNAEKNRLQAEVKDLWKVVFTQ